MRLFIGIKTGCEAHLAALQDALKKLGRGRFTHPDNLHITLKFLGELTPGKVPGLCAAISEAGGEPFVLEIGGAHMFNRSGILAADVSGETEKLAALAARLETALEQRGIQKEMRPFKAHITLARDYQPGGSLRGIPQAGCSFTVDEVVLFESRRENGRLVYMPLFTHKLKP